MIEEARRSAAKIVTALKQAEADVITCTENLAKAKARLVTLQQEKTAAKHELQAIATWSVHGLPDEGDNFPLPVMRAMGFEERKR